MKYFVVSDIHSFYKELIEALDKNGFDPNNENHTLIVCGDIFDRGPDSKKVYEYLMNLKRKVLIRGNHEYLLKKVLEKDFPDHYDFSNGTVRTICSLTDTNPELLEIYNPYLSTETIYKTWKQAVKKFKKLKIVEWTMSKEWNNYFETKDYIFVHSFVPLHKLNKWVSYYGAKPEDLEAIPEWKKEADPYQWEGATWGCPYELVDAFPQDKTIVCGHWATTDFFKHYDHDEDKDDCPIYISDKIIGIDACTAWTKRVNVFVFEE